MITAATSLFILLFATSCSQKKIAPKKNPFTFEKTGLPFQSSFEGTGMPDYIRRDLAENIIDKEFNKQEFKLTKNYLYKKNNMSFVLNGYDKTNKIGYVYLTYNNLSDDSIIPWDREPFYAYSNDVFGKDTLSDKERKLEGFNIWLQGENGSDIKIMIRNMNKSLLSSENKLVAAVEKSNDDNFIKKAYKTLWQKQKKYILSLAEIKSIIKNSEANGVFIAVISSYDDSLAVYPDHDIDNQLEPEMHDKKENKYTQEDALNYLRKNVSVYIAWAKSKGLNYK